ncbi:D-amino-acid oxidase [Auriscalpium vulgare]|uniref:D-amino-acid oxidase n=1 Tax=Auriscalpium vulgare TaxID=40419 RepID=A0ACB8SAF3_9AGAM|nr:D-amino-acid oxidase [Auriscalpium vulgare]
MSQPQVKNVVVIGAGVVGLTTALKIQEKGGYNVTIVAETFPTDPKTIKYTSHWAGAHHVSAAAHDDLRQQKLERETFDVMWELSAPGGEAEGCFLRAPQTEYYLVPQANPDFLSFSPDFKHLPPADYQHLPNVVSAISLTTLGINTPVYLPYLLARFLARGGVTVRASLQHINQVLEGGVEALTGARAGTRAVDALVVCAGIGARALGGVEDKDVHPVRGQTVLLRAPWIKSGKSLVGETGSQTYIIPRRSGNIIVGGTRVPDDWYPVPRPETTLDILSRGLALCPELAPPTVRAERAPTVDDLKPLIIEEGCGLRPGRKGGIRLEAEWFALPEAGGRKVPVVHNYGHGGYGFQTSWGSASVALEILEKELSQSK